MRDFLWALDPKKDSAHDAAVLLKDFGQELFDKTNIEFEVERIETSLQRYKTRHGLEAEPYHDFQGGNA